MFDFAHMGRLMDLARDIDTDGLIELAEKVDLPELIRVVRKLDDEQLRHFEREVRRAADPDMAHGQAPDQPPWSHLPFRRAAVLGAGTMGAQIAAHLANAGLSVLLLDMPASNGDRNKTARDGLTRTKSLRPDPFFDAHAAARVEIGNFDDDLHRLADVEWVIEAVVERLEIKRSLFQRVEEHVAPDAVISSNTSGIPIREIVEGRSESFRRRFLGTHFFNPPRYLRLLELIPTPETSAAVLDRVAAFGRVHLGKGIVVARDVPYFIGNRIGVYGQLQAMRLFFSGRYTIEEVDVLSGPLVGRPRSATFRTADVVGLDVLKSVTENLYDAVPDDESRNAFEVPALLERLVATGALGAKTKKGFYKKVDSEILSVDPETLEYRPGRAPVLDSIEDLKRLPLNERLRALYADDGRAGTFFRETTMDLLSYAARRVPEVTDNPADVDRAIRWGFGWELGPFETWDAIGFRRVLDDMRAAGYALPSWIDELEQQGDTSFYRDDDASREVYLPAVSSYAGDPVPPDQLSLAAIRRNDRSEIWTNEEAALLDAGDGVAVFEFRSRGNALGTKLMQGLDEALNLVESRGDLRGMVVGNEGKNFAVGANLFEVVAAMERNGVASVEPFVQRFQETIQRVRYARKPVVVAAHERALGGACEMLMACSMPVAAAESYIGLVELGVGIIPAGTGSMHLASLASERAPGGHPSEIQGHLQKFYQNVAMARVAESAHQAMEMGYLSPCASIVMNPDRRLFVARQRVIALSDEGYRPPARRREITVLGRPGRAAFSVQLQQYFEGRFISEYDRHLGEQLALVLTGGDLSGPQRVDEEYLIDLEREVFMRLLGEERTRARIRHMLKTGKPLRN